MKESESSTTATPVSVSAATAPLVSDLIHSAAALRIRATKLDSGPTLVDAGIDCRGSLEAGRRIAEICMGGQGTVTLQAPPELPEWPLGVMVHATDPVLACMASQYAGWELKHKGEDGTKFQALGSGPGRALAAREELFQDLGYQDRYDEACLVVESDELPPEPVLLDAAKKCGVEADALTVVVTPTASLAGVVQVSARVLEVALHKLHELEFPLGNVVDGSGVAPVAPAGGPFLEAMGRTNDAVIYGGRVHLFLDGEPAEAKRICEDLPSAGAADYGRPFARILEGYDFDFYKVDGSLFSPAQVAVTSLQSGETFTAGGIDTDALARAFRGASSA